MSVTLAPAWAHAYNATASIDAGQVRAVMSPYGLGLHTSPYYNQMGHANVDDRLEEAGVTTLRYGGGGYADVFHWSITRAGNGITGNGLSPWFGQASNFGYVGAGSDFASFLGLLDRTDNSQAVVTVNYGSAQKLVGGQSAVPDFGGQPKEAAAWVAYANADAAIYGTPADVVLGVDQQGNDWKTAGYWARLRASTAAEYQAWAQADGVFNSLNSFLAVNRDAPVGLKYWEIGNETFGTAYYGGDGDGYSVDYDLAYGTNRDDHPSLSPAQYGQDLVEYAQLMKAVDPTIKIGAVLATPPDDYSWSYADLNDSGSKQLDEPYWNDEVLAQAAHEIDFVMVHWYPYAGENANGDSLISAVRTKLPPMINGATPGLDLGSSAGIRDTLTAHGIPDAEIMVTEFNYFGSLQTSQANAAESVFVADAYATWLELGVTSVQYLEMLTKDFLSDSSGLTRGSAFYGISMVDKLAEPGDSFVAATSSSTSARVHAALQDDGSLAILIANASRTDSANVTVDVAGLLLGETGTRFSLTGGTNLTQAAATGLGNSFVVNVAQRSIVTLVIPPIDAADFDGDGEVDVDDLAAWTAGFAGAGPATHAQGDADGDLDVDGADFLVWQQRLGGGLNSIDASVAVPEPGCRLLLLVGMIAVTSAPLPIRRAKP